MGTSGNESFTPGPWEILDSCGEISVCQKDSELPICIVSGRGADDTDTQLLPDARLIASAPDLLKVLENIAGHTSNAIRRNKEERPTSLLDLHSTVITVQIMARNAIAKALG